MLAPLTAAIVTLALAADTLAPLSAPARLHDLDLSASTDGEDAGVVVTEVAAFVDAEAIFAADSAIAPLCAARALR